MRMSEVETNAHGREVVERRRRGRTTVAAQRVRAQRIDGDQENVLGGDGAQIGLARADTTRRQQQRAEHDDASR